MILLICSIQLFGNFAWYLSLLLLGALGKPPRFKVAVRVTACQDLLGLWLSYYWRLLRAQGSSLQRLFSLFGDISVGPCVCFVFMQALDGSSAGSAVLISLINGGMPIVLKKVTGRFLTPIDIVRANIHSWVIFSGGATQPIILALSFFVVGGPKLVNIKFVGADAHGKFCDSHLCCYAVE